MRKIILKRLIKKLNKLCKELNEEYDVNFGGCCWLTAEIAQHLQQLEVPFDLCIASDEEKNESAIREEVQSQTINEWEDSNSVCGLNTANHYYLHIADIGTINCSGHFLEYYQYTLPNVTSDQIRWIYKTGDWNETYNIHHNIKITRILNSFFKMYEVLHKFKSIKKSKI
jgi:hypothetical protein